MKHRPAPVPDDRENECAARDMGSAIIGPGGKHTIPIPARLAGAYLTSKYKPTGKNALPIRPPHAVHSPLMLTMPNAEGDLAGNGRTSYNVQRRSSSTDGS